MSGAVIQTTMRSVCVEMKTKQCVLCFRRLDEDIRTVVRGQTNVGQDGRQVRLERMKVSVCVCVRVQEGSCSSSHSLDHKSLFLF